MKISDDVEFNYMQETVDNICASLCKEPSSWVFGTNTFYKEGTNFKLWDGLSSPITDHWDGISRIKVFSDRQGEQIREAFNYARSHQASQTQAKLIDLFK